MHEQTGQSISLLPLLLYSYVSMGDQSTALLSDFLSKWLPLSQMPSRVFNPEKERHCNHVWPITSPHFVAFPPSLSYMGWKGPALHIFGFFKCFSISHPRLWPLLGPQGGLCAERKATFLVIFLMKHSRNISLISLQMPKYWPSGIVSKVKWGCINAVDKM